MPAPAHPAGNRTLAAWSVALGLATVWAAIAPRHPADFWLEIATPAVMWIACAATLRWYRFTGLAYALLGVEALVLIVGAHYTHAEVPAFEWPRAWWGWERNHFDRVAHFAVGFLCVVPAREIWWRWTPLRGAWLAVAAGLSIMAWAAFYEIVEWWIAVSAAPDAAEAYLGTQGDVWDAQKDMLLDTIGALAGVLAWTRLHDCRLEKGV